MEMNKKGFFPFSKKQLTVLCWWCEKSQFKDKDAIICDGAVRSGKTLCMSLSFVLWAFYRFDGESFAICGKTIASLKRNVVTPILPILSDLGFSCNYKTSSNVVEIKKNGVKNRFYIFGGKDESSASLIQGITLAGVLLDEVALMPRSFVEQAIARCSVDGSKFWFNCNPENPYHWFYEEWIKKYKEKNSLYLKFLMSDNPSLSQNMINRYKSLYSGAFYDRFVLGKWVAASGLVYPFFGDKCIEESPPMHCSEYYISCDYGIVNPSSFGLWGRHGGTWYRTREYYFDSRAAGHQKTDEEYYSDLCELANGHDISAVIVDPSASSFMECIRRHDKFEVWPANNDVKEGIQKVSDALKGGQFKICAQCKDSIREFSLYRWNDKVAGDCPRKENDHAMDDIRYFAATLPQKNEDSFACIAAFRY
ncbi:MAG: PBSX family phage terminase large subunit [Oscillospiraceae bacterium]|nr:PBSX family phage terminase large subunit [Oscillospiraceae bacterium]